MALEGLLKRQYTIKQALISGILASVASIGNVGSLARGVDIFRSNRC
jgi:hypothetical protein